MTDPAAPSSVAPHQSFQDRVKPWLDACFGPEIGGDKYERNHRFLEEALELVQSTGCTQSEAHQLVDYVFGRAVGAPVQEVGGVMNTLAALCLAHGYDMDDAAEVELARVWTKVEAIRAKQAAKPKHSPIPEHPAPRQDDVEIKGLKSCASNEHEWHGMMSSSGRSDLYCVQCGYRTTKTPLPPIVTAFRQNDAAPVPAPHVNADNIALVLVENAHVKDGMLVNAGYLAVKIAEMIERGKTP